MGRHRSRYPRVRAGHLGHAHAARHGVRRATGPDGRLLWENQPHVVRRAISETTARTLTSILKGVADEGGTGVLASVEGFEVAGKTGTAQKAERGVYTKK